MDKKAISFLAVLAALTWVCVAIFVVITVGCTPSTTETASTLPPRVVVVETTPNHSTGGAVDSFMGKKLWDEALKNAIIESELIKAAPTDADEFNMLPKEWTNWANILAMIAFYESNFDPNTTYTEGFDDATGVPVVSRGLFQLSLESGRGYGCPFTNAQDVHDPVKNIQCAVKILERWVVKDKRIAGKQTFGGYLGGARYWAVLRGNRKYTVESLKAIKAANL